MKRFRYSELSTKSTLLLITIFAAFVRSLHLTYHMNADEIAAITSSIKAPLYHIIILPWYPTYHKLYDILTHLTVQVLGETDITFRLLSVILGVAAVPLIYWIAKKLFKSSSYGLAAAFIFAVSPLSVLWSQKARGYSLAIFLILVAFGCLYAGFVTGRKRFWIFCSICLGLSVYTQVFSILSVATAGILATLGTTYSLLQRQKAMRKHLLPSLAPMIAVLAGVALALLLLLKDIPAIYESAKVQGAIWPNEMTLSLKTFWTLASMMGLGGTNIIGMTTSLILAGLGVAVLVRHDIKALFFLLGWLLLPTLLLFAGTLLGASYAVPRYLAFLSFPAFVLLETGGIVVFADSIRWLIDKIKISTSLKTRIRLGGVILIAGFLFWINLSTYSKMFGPFDYDFKSMAAYLEKEVQPGDLIIYEIFSRDLKYYFSAERHGARYINLIDWVNEVLTLTDKEYRAWWVPFVTIETWPLQGWKIEKFNAAKLLHLSPQRAETIQELSRTATLILNEEVRQNPNPFQVNLQIDQKIAEGEILLWLGDTERAADEFNEVLNNPSTRNSYNIECMVLHAVASAYQKNGKWELAKKLWEQAAKVCTPIDSNSSNILGIKWPDAKPSLMLGKIAERAGEYGKAINFYEHAAHLRPDYREAHIALTSLLENLGKSEDVIIYWQKFISQNKSRLAVPNLFYGGSDYEWASDQLRNAYQKLQDSNKAEKVYLKEIELNPKEILPRAELARLYKAQGKYQEAIALYQQVISLDPQIVNHHRELARLYEQAGQMDKAIEKYRLLLEHNPKDIATHFALSQIYLAQGKLTEAAKGLNSALQFSPKDVKLNIALGRIYVTQSMNKPAINSFQKALEQDPGSIEAHELLADAYRQAGQYESGIAELKKVMKLRPGYAGPYYGLGQIYISQKRYSDSIKAFNNGLKISPDGLNLWVGLGNAYRESKDFDNAAKAYQKAIELHPHETWPKYMLAILSKEQGKIDEAVALFKQALVLEPGRADFHRELALLYDQKGKMDNALAEYKQIAKLQPDASISYIELGQFYMRSKMWTEAIEAHQKAVAINPKDAQPRAYLGQAYQAAGLLKEAILQFEKAVELAPYRKDMQKLLAEAKEKSH